MKQPQNDYELNGIFPIPIYQAKRNSDLDSTEKKEIENIIKEGVQPNEGNSYTINSYIFNNKLKKIKQFCEQQIRIYIEEVINPEEELDFYITQSWLNITKPGGFHHAHFHSNSIISGVFYVATEEDDKITFGDPNNRIKQRVEIEVEEFNMWNSSSFVLPVNNNKLILFPSWLEHSVESNEKATTDRVSISFNTFARGTFGSHEALNKLIL